MSNDIRFNFQFYRIRVDAAFAFLPCSLPSLLKLSTEATGIAEIKRLRRLSKLTLDNF